MTSSRIVRSTKGRIFLYVCAAVLVTGLVACYNNARIQLEDVQRSFSICLRDRSDFTKDLSDLQYKNQRLEKTLEAEKNEHTQTKAEFQMQRKEDKLKVDKTLAEAKIRFNTLQQHYNLLQTQHDDFKDERSKIQREQLDTINQLQVKLQEVQAQAKLIENDKDDNIEHLKVQNDALKNENQLLKDKLNLPKDKPDTTEQSKVVPSEPLKKKQENENQGARPQESFNAGDEKNVLPIPKVQQENLGISKSTPKAVSVPNLIGAQPIMSPSSTPETKKSTEKTQNLMLPLPYQQIPQGVVVPPNENLMDISKKTNDDNMSNNNNKDNVGEKALLNSAFNDIADGDDNANEVFDPPNNNDHGKNNKKSSVENNRGEIEKKPENLLLKPLVDEMNINNDKDDMDYGQQNGLDQDDDAGDGIPPDQADEAVRH